MHEFHTFEDGVSTNEVTFEQEIISKTLRVKTDTVDESEFENENDEEENIAYKLTKFLLLHSKCFTIPRCTR